MKTTMLHPGTSCALADCAIPPYLLPTRDEGASKLINLSQTHRRLRVLITGGGPVGLILATSLKELFHQKVEVTVFEARWKKVGGGVVWKSAKDGNKRRRQVITLQSKPLATLPPLTRSALLPRGGFSEIWPYSADSPVSAGRPKNLRIVDIEDRLLEHAGRLGVRLLPEKFCLDQYNSADYDILAICEGAHSDTRERLKEQFGAEDPTPYSIGGQPVEDTVLGLQVKSPVKSVEAVVLTIIQNRFLLNANKDGCGYLNIRLTQAEAAAYHRQPDIRSQQLWPGIREGLKLFNIHPGDVGSVTAFKLSMTHRSRFSAALSRHSSENTAYAFLLGDAANAIHIWPGRGLTQGLVSAVSLARCLHERWRSGRTLREADFSKHEAVMHMLQHRHKTRAWHAMAKRVDAGLRPIQALIADGFQAPYPPRELLLQELTARCVRVQNRLQSRLPDLAFTDDILKRLQLLDDKTLSALVASGAWETHLSGGPEVDLDMFYPQYARRSEMYKVS